MRCCGHGKSEVVSEGLPVTEEEMKMERRLLKPAGGRLLLPTTDEIEPDETSEGRKRK